MAVGKTASQHDRSELGEKSHGRVQMNEESSRSHAIFMITCSQKSRSDGTIKTGKIFLVDLVRATSRGSVRADQQYPSSRMRVNG